MKGKITLLTPPVSREERYGGLAAAASSLPSLGVLWIAAVLRRAGHAVRVVDAMAQGMSVSEAVRETLRGGPDIVGISSTTLTAVRAGEIAKVLKEASPAMRIIMGGVHITAAPAETMGRFPWIDVGVLGEGEVTASELVGALLDGGELSGVRGIAYREDGGIRFTPPRPYIKEMDGLPLPAWDLLPGFPDKFRPVPTRYRKLPVAHLVTGRGCPYRCTFCDRSVFGQRYRYFSADYVLECIGELAGRYGVREIVFEDDTFTVNRGRLLEICERIRREHPRLSWSCLGRADTVDPGMLRLMRDAGCWQIGYGIESGDQDILDSVNKGVTVEEVERAVRWSKEAGMYVKGFFIIGFPGERPDSLERTIRLALNLPLDDITVDFMTPFPGTELSRIAGQLGRFEDAWERMNLLEPVFVPHGLKASDLIRAQRRMMRRFYLRPRTFLSYGRRALGNPGLTCDLLRVAGGVLW